MEHILEAIAHRVVTTNLNEQALRRVYCVELRRKTKLTKFESTLTGTDVADAYLERFHKMRIQFVGFAAPVAICCAGTFALACCDRTDLCCETALLPLFYALAVSGLSIDAIERFVKNTPTTTTSWGYNANQVVCTEVTAEAAGPPSALMSRTAESLSVSILDWVVQFSHRLVLTRGIAIRSYPSLVSGEWLTLLRARLPSYS